MRKKYENGITVEELLQLSEEEMNEIANGPTKLAYNK